MSRKIVAQVAALPKMPFAELQETWRTLFGKEPPAYNRPYLIKRLAYRIQELASEGLSARAERLLREVLDDAGDGAESQIERARHRNAPPAAGTLLVREWNGRRYEVLAVEGGYELEGRKYKSLSAIAKAITGSHWNGPLFFGLRDAGSGRRGKGAVR